MIRCSQNVPLRREPNAKIIFPRSGLSERLTRTMLRKAGTFPRLDTWYHTFDLPDGTVTRGLFDHRSLVGRLPIPASLAGKRCLDLASSDGFFAFEMARRGGEVTSVDLDDPAGRDWQEDTPESGSTGARARFDQVRQVTGLDVRRLDLNLYDVSPETVGEPYDFVFMGNVLLHVSDPARVLRNVRSVTAGDFLCFETISMALTLTRPGFPAAALGTRQASRWWTPNLAAHKRLLRASGFEITKSTFPLFQPFGPGTARKPSIPVHKAPNPIDYILFWTLVRRSGVPSAATLCR
jgi:tRNA (mo5U34)-methyltransferase